MFAIDSYKKANSAQEAVCLLIENPTARLIAGGTDVLIKLRELEPGYGNLIDIHELSELKPILLQSDGTIQVGAGATFSEIIESPIIQKYIPMLGEAAASVAGPQIRNVGTIGGNLCNGAVSADMCAPVLALDGVLHLLGPSGLRTIPAQEFHLGPGKVDINPGEVLLYLTFKEQDWKKQRTSYVKYAMREAMDIATIGCAVALEYDQERIIRLRLAYSVAAPVPIRCLKAEAVAAGRSLSLQHRQETLEAICAALPADVAPRSSWRASQDFRLHIIRVLAERLILHCFDLMPVGSES